MDRILHRARENNKIIIFGAGMMGDLVYKLLKVVGCKKQSVLFIDNNVKMYRKRRRGIKICSPDQGIRKWPEAIFIIANINHGGEMKKQLLMNGISEESIIVCNDECLLRQEIQKRAVMVYEDKKFIYDVPREKTLNNKYNMLKARIKAFGYLILMNQHHSDNKMEKKYDVSVCAIFKNEGPYLKEWIEYHKIVGIQHFYMYNNNSNDDYLAILQPYIEAGDVTFLNWPYEQGQMSAYRDCVKNFRDESKWIGFIDIDEFIVPIDYDNLYDFLKKFEKNRGSVIIYWKFFGSAGKWERDITGLVTEDFLVSWRKHSNIGKCFYNTAYDFIPNNPLNVVMHHKMWTGYKGKVVPPVNCFGKVCVDDLNIAAGDHFPIQINHYFTKSVCEYDIKKSKGDVFFKKNPHDEMYFMKHDMKCGAIDMSIYKYMILLKRNMSKR